MEFSGDAQQSVYEIRSEILAKFERDAKLSELLRILCLRCEEHSPTEVRCSVLINQNNRLLHGAGPSLPKEYLEAIDGLEESTKESVLAVPPCTEAKR